MNIVDEALRGMGLVTLAGGLFWGGAALTGKLIDWHFERRRRIHRLDELCRWVGAMPPQFASIGTEPSLHKRVQELEREVERLNGLLTDHSPVPLSSPTPTP